ncbi:MAG: tyrosine-protein phosphatase [Actinobacteria bacterium]|nr:tyrosine-protein phosphatase [Actinomycetota bacterium]
MRDRVLAWDGCLNVRDLGGIATEEGAVTRFRAVVRADSVRHLSDEGWKALVDYGVRTIIDLRFGSELDADPPRELPVEVVHVPVLPDRDSHHWRELDALADDAPDRVAATRAVYREFLSRFHGEFARAVGAVASAPTDGAVLVHCVGGKDRTGLVTAFLLRVAGVDPARIADDYGLSERNLQSRDGTWVAAAQDERERERRMRIAASPREAMAHVLRDVDEHWGSAHGYLRAGELDAAAIHAIRARLLGAP